MTVSARKAAKTFHRFVSPLPERRGSRVLAKNQVVIVGSWIEAILPGDLPLFFKDGVCIDRRNGTPMEMDAYSIYLALKAIEKRDAIDYSFERRSLVDAILTRRERCGGFWNHGAWTGSGKETHLRFTAAAIRLLTEASKDGVICDPSIVISAILRHTEYSEELDCGTWYLHDSLESPETGVRHPDRVAQNAAYGSSNLNCLVLNTHIDTLVTILDVIQSIRMSDAHRQLLISRLNAGLRALDYVLQPNASFRWRRFARFDCAFRTQVFSSYSYESLLARALRGAFIRACFYLRQRIKSRLPAFAFPDGYLERDVSLPGTHFDYHVVNAHDLARLIVAIKSSGLIVEPNLLDRCQDLIDRALDYAVGSDYWTYVKTRMLRSGTAVLLCEAIICRLSTKDSVPRSWIEAYCAIRRNLPPTAALLGYDPIIVENVSSADNGHGRQETIHLRGGGRLTVDVMTAAFAKEREGSDSLLVGHLA